MKTYVWWSNSNPGSAVEVIAANTKGTSSPVRRMPMLRGGQLHDPPDDLGNVETFPHEVPGHIANYGKAAIADAGHLMLDLESGSEVIKEGGDVAKWNTQVLELVKIARAHCPIGTAVGPYPNPTHKLEHLDLLLPGLTNATGIYVAVHSHQGQKLSDYLKRTKEVAGKRKVTCYLWVFGNPPAGLKPPSPDAMWQVQGQGSWVTVAQLQEKVKTVLTHLPGAQIVCRGQGDNCAKAIQVTHALL